jgi:TolB-like protein
LWPAGTFVDFERGLNAAVKRLRAAIGESGTRPRYIETLPRRGYRFIAPVEAINLDQAGRNACGMFARLEHSNEPPRVAVLAFDKIGEGAEGSGFAEGLAEELVTELGRLGSDHLKVVARAASDLAQRRGGTIRQVGAALRAAYLIDGAVRQIGDRVRVSAQLIEARDETQLWAECYERRCGDWLSVQSSLAREIAVSVALVVIEQQEGALPSSARDSALPSDPADGSPDRLR